MKWGCFVLFAASTWAQNAKIDPELKGVVEDWKECHRAKEGGGETLRFVDISSPSEVVKWQLSSGEAESDRGLTEFFLVKNKLKVAVVHLSPPSGDHHLVSTYCFNDSGRLSFFIREFSTFHGDVKEEFRIWVGKDEVLKTNKKVLDLKTKKTRRSQGLYQS